ncbi:MAG TPA: type II toxin-antitoxin system ParD family antitoxin [Candidatus Cybelea sp.]|jgi:putative addiction module CopG family antidote|nr:type II toxin-antitoxin system ParD family antitoxin [Candidatus Cybelea sp.]
MVTKSISFPPDLEAYIDAKVAAGEYADESDVVCDGLRLMMQEEAQKMEWLRAAIAEGDADIRAGRVYRSAEVRAHLAKITGLRNPSS